MRAYNEWVQNNLDAAAAAATKKAEAAAAAAARQSATPSKAGGGGSRTPHKYRSTGRSGETVHMNPPNSYNANVKQYVQHQEQHPNPSNHCFVFGSFCWILLVRQKWRGRHALLGCLELVVLLWWTETARLHPCAATLHACVRCPAAARAPPQSQTGSARPRKTNGR